MNILLPAYACEPGRGSEPGVGWHMAKALAHEHQVWVLTSHAHEEATEAELARNPDANLRVVYLDPFGWVLDWSQKRTPRAAYLHYYLWQVWAYFVGRSLHRQVNFDVAHHVTYMKYSTPSFVSFLPIPFFFGPVGGGESAPKPFHADFSRRARLYELERDWARRVGEWDPFVRRTIRRSALVWATTDETAQRLHRLGGERVTVSSGMGLDRHEREVLEQLPAPPAGPVRFVSMGRLLHWKGFHLGLRGFADAALPDAEFWILGDGPERESLEALAVELGISRQVKFWGEVDRQSALARLGECHVLVHPSLHDSGGWVCLEAMAAGRPVICLDLGGPAVQVTPACGIRVPAGTPTQAVRDLAAAMHLLATDKGVFGEMARAGQRRVADELSWNGRANVSVEAYRNVV